MRVGIDIGGTNTDIAVIGEEIKTAKIPNYLGFDAVFRKLSELVGEKKIKLVISTSVPLNLIVSKFDEIKAQVMLFPGSGLNYESYGKQLKGAVNHRGDVVEDLDEREVEEVLRENKADCLAIACKFSIRNPELELKAYEIAKKYYSEDEIALSHHIPVLNYPLRINTTIINAKLMKKVHEMVKSVKAYYNEVYFYKGDGGIIPYQIALNNPSELYNSSPAAVAFGAYFLTGEKYALVVDIGGTTTDFVFLGDGKPKIIERAVIGGLKSCVRCVESHSIPFGGDSLVEETIKPVRISQPIAFGGNSFTLTDALNCLGYEIGDYKKSREAKRDDCERAVEDFISIVAEKIKELKAEKIIGTGFLAPFLIKDIAKKAGVKYIVPEHCESANAVGVAVSRLSYTLYARFDTENKIAVYDGEATFIKDRIYGFPEDEELIQLAVDKLISIAKDFGEEVEEKDVRVLYFNSYVVVKGGIRRGKIADVIVQIEPGIREEFS